MSRADQSFSKHVAEDRRVGVGDRHADRPTARPTIGAHLELHVEAAGRQPRGRLAVRALELTPRPAHGRARGDDRRGPAVVADRDVQPVRRQRVLGAAEHRADVRGVVAPGVEVGVLGDAERQVQRRVRDRVQVRLDGLALGGTLGQQLGQPRAQRPPRVRARRHVGVPGGLVERAARHVRQQPRPGRGADIEDAVADRDAAARIARAAARRREHAAGQVRERELARLLVRARDPARAAHQAPSGVPSNSFGRSAQQSM